LSLEAELGGITLPQCRWLLSDEVEAVNDPAGSGTLGIVRFVVGQGEACKSICKLLVLGQLCWIASCSSFSVLDDFGPLMPTQT
jgi:hypothetical protein